MSTFESTKSIQERGISHVNKNTLKVHTMKFSKLKIHHSAGNGKVTEN